jgi:type VI secretion system lysozyme-like protein
VATNAGPAPTRALLFDRLVESDPALSGAERSHTISRAEAQQSVAREIGCILNTRIDPIIDDIDPRERTVLEYGLPDFTALAAASSSDTTRLATAAERAILAFEPRLKRPSVTVVVEATTRDTVTFLITGLLAVNNQTESFSFPVDLGSQDHTDAG